MPLLANLQAGLSSTVPKESGLESQVSCDLVYVGSGGVGSAGWSSQGWLKPIGLCTAGGAVRVGRRAKTKEGAEETPAGPYSL